jgi:hypothetical protein
MLAPAVQIIPLVSLDFARTGDGGDGVSYRTFLDSTGKRWEVWLVTPAAAERRKADRRAGREPSEKNPFRRTVEVASEYSQGWLCFEGDGEKRRLAPVPEGWEEAGPDRMMAWLQTARLVVKCSP